MTELRWRRTPWGRAPRPGGLTLIELLIAATLSLVVMGSLAGLFGLFGRSVRQSQATMNQSALLRSAAWLLRQDLAGVTCPTTGWLSPETSSGYFELIEGPARDTSFALDGQGRPTDNLTADTDDILLFTTQSLAGSYVGRFGGAMTESPYAEVAWFCRRAQDQPVAGTTLYDLHRRQCLVVTYPDLTNQLDELVNENTIGELVAQGLISADKTHAALPVLIDLLRTSNPNETNMLRYFDLAVLSDFVNLTQENIRILNSGTMPSLQATPPDASPSSLPLKATEDQLAKQLTNFGLLKLLESLPSNALPILTNCTGCDLSLRTGTMALTTANGTLITTGTYLLPNSLGDLTKRENRFMRGHCSFEVTTGSTTRISSGAGGGFPFAFPVVSSTVQSGTGAVLIPLATSKATFADTKRAWEDVVLTHVIAFDVRVFDPRAIMSAAGTATRLPGDPGYVAAGDGRGAHVDLGWGGGVPGLRTDPFPPAGKTAFQSAGVMVSGTNRLLATYDTWSRHYEFNGFDDDGDGVIDEALHGVDVDGNGWTEDNGETETSPPYPVPLRGLEVRIRYYEPTSRQVRQVTVRHAFTK